MNDAVTPAPIVLDDSTEAVSVLYALERADLNNERRRRESDAA